jgi:hypothetical protein
MVIQNAFDSVGSGVVMRWSHVTKAVGTLALQIVTILQCFQNSGTPRGVGPESGGFS